MEDDLHFWQMEEDLNILVNGGLTSIFWQKEDYLNILVIGRQPQSFGKWNTISILCYGRQHQIFNTGSTKAI